MGYDSEILLHSGPKATSDLEAIKDIILNNDMVRTAGGYVSVYDKSEKFFWAKSFPDLYPYGRGCQHSKYFDIEKLNKYHKHVLERGNLCKNGRRFQNSYSLIFLMYTYEMNRILNGIVVIAQKGHSNELTVGNVNDLIDHFGNDDKRDGNIITSDEEIFITNNIDQRELRNVLLNGGHHLNNINNSKTGLFGAIADQIYNNEFQYSTIRTDIFKFMKKNKRNDHLKKELIRGLTQIIESYNEIVDCNYTKERLNQQTNILNNDSLYEEHLQKLSFKDSLILGEEVHLLVAMMIYKHNFRLYFHSNYNGKLNGEMIDWKCNHEIVDSLIFISHDIFNNHYDSVVEFEIYDETEDENDGDVDDNNYDDFDKNEEHDDNNIHSNNIFLISEKKQDNIEINKRNMKIRKEY